MKKEIRQAIKKAIEESDLNGYTWKIKENSLIWSYLDIEFTYDDWPEKEMLFLRDKYSNVSVWVWYSDDYHADCKTLEEAYYLVTKMCIARANYLY